MKKNNKKHLVVLDALRAFHKVHGINPSIRDLMDMTGITSTCMVTYYMTRLDTLGMIRRAGKLSRSTRIVAEGQPSGEMVRKAKEIDVYSARVGVSSEKKFVKRTAERYTDTSKLNEQELQASIERVARKALAQESAGVDVVHDYRRSFPGTMKASRLG